MQAEGTSKGLGSHTFLELTKYSSKTMLHFNLPPFDMIVIDVDSRFTFKVDHGGRVNRTITKRTISPRGLDRGGSILPKGPNYQEASDYQDNETHLACTHAKM